MPGAEASRINARVMRHTEAATIVKELKNKCQTLMIGVGK
jgi:hypothetical protein